MTKEELEKIQLALSKKILQVAKSGGHGCLKELDSLNQRLSAVNRAAYYVMLLSKS